MKELIEVLRVQRHDFMNHLQIISGLIQLNKTDRVFDYIQKLALDMAETGEITALELPEAAAALLINRLRAAQQGIELSFGISTGLAGCRLDGYALAALIDELMAVALQATARENCMPREIYVDIKEEEDGFILTSGFVCNPEQFTGASALLKDLCREHGAVFRYEWAAPDKVQLRLEIPKQK
jgi:sensor histidine kinase regulating citrate/malate metabolism